MIISHVKNKIKMNYQINIYYLIYVFITIFILFLILGFRNVVINKVESDIVFYDKSFLIPTGVINQNFPNGFQLSNKQLEDMQNKFSFVSIYKDVDMTSSTRQDVDFTAVSSHFINTGVPVFDQKLFKVVVEKICLIVGDIWEENSKEAVVVIDEQTANLVFGYTNVVGNIINTRYGELKVIGVVSNTFYRNKLIEKAKAAGQSIDESSYPTNAYISHGFLSTLNELPTFNEYVIVKDESKNLKEDLKSLLNIPENDNSIIVGRQDIIDLEMMNKQTFFLVIVSLASVFLVLGIVNIINVSAFAYRINRKNVGIYKVVGYSNKQLILLSFVEGVILGFFSSLISLGVGFIILLVGTLFIGMIGYLKIWYLLTISLIFILITTLLVTLINLITTALNINKNILYYLKGE